VVGDGTWLKLAEVLARLQPYGYTNDRIREIAAAGYLRTTRPPSIGPGVPHRRFETASVDAYEAALKLPDAKRDAALAELLERNRAMEAGPTAEPE
jgi:hypothetical protein